MLNSDLARAEAHLDEYLRRTGVRGSAGDPSRRYLWNDAYAVETLVAIARGRATREPIEDAVRLAGLVHATLGRHRQDDGRIGWISGLGELAGQQHPTKGGLRIGKPLRERAIAEPFDEFLEWERDGQYFHYLTRWMEALCALAGATGERAWCRMAIELASRACAAFTYFPSIGSPPRMYWKMSIDLSRPLVKSMGLLDPLDGFVTIARVRATERALDGEPVLARELEQLHAMLIEPAMWATTDPLGIGGLLHAATEQCALVESGDLAFEPLLHELLAAIHRSLEFFASNARFSQPLERRLASRELGLAIGVQGIDAMLVSIKRAPERFGAAGDFAALEARLDSMSKFSLLARHIEDTWDADGARATQGWLEHIDINQIMLAASLAGVIGAAPSVERSAATGR